jgi:hypothetical protein
MPDSKQLLKFCWAALALCCSMSAVAAQTVFVTDLSVIPYKSVAIAAVIAVVAGMGSTLAKIASRKVKIDNMTIVVISDTLLSLIAGLAAFCACAAYEVPPFKTFLAILFAGFGNARVIASAMNLGISQMTKLGGAPDDRPSQKD